MTGERRVFVVAIATINAVGGGAFADILLVGSGCIAAAVCAAVTVATRVAAVTYGRTVPTAQVLRTSP